MVAVFKKTDLISCARKWDMQLEVICCENKVFYIKLVFQEVFAMACGGVQWSLSLNLDIFLTVPRNNIKAII